MFLTPGINNLWTESGLLQLLVTGCWESTLTACLEGPCLTLANSATSVTDRATPTELFLTRAVLAAEAGSWGWRLGTRTGGTADSGCKHSYHNAHGQPVSLPPGRDGALRAQALAH